MVTRARLTEQLVQAESTLTLISAPTGFGKTTLLTEWLADLPDDGPSVAWLSLDTRDNDPTSFWSYVVAALNEAAARDLGTDALALLRSAQAPTGAVVAALVNDLSAGDERIILVLDDFHVINVRDVHDEVALLLEQCPPQCAWSSPPGRIPPCRWPGCVAVGTWPRFASLICASRPTRLRPISTSQWG